MGTISAAEAKEMLIKNKGNVWHAVTQCIEQRQHAFNTIQAQGNYSREDIVTSLTAYNGNIESALNELNRIQMKPFLLKIQNAPVDSSNNVKDDLKQPSSSSTEHQGNSPSNGVPSNDPTANENPEPAEKMEKAADEKNDILRDIEAIIGSMEEKQSKQAENLLSTIENLVGNMIISHTSRTLSNASSFTSGIDRIDIKSPIPSKASNSMTIADNIDVETDVKNFVTRHIQDVVPDVAAIISKELDEIVVQNEPYKQVHEEEQPKELQQLNQLPNHSETVAHIQSGETNESHILNENPNSDQVQLDIGTLSTTEGGNLNDTTDIETASSDQNVQLPRQNIVRNNAINAPRYVVTKSNARYIQKQMDKRRIRELEKQLKRQQKMQRYAFNNAERSDSRSTGYLSDSTVVADEINLIEQLPTVSNEKTFSLSIVEQAALIDDNKEHNQASLTLLNPQNPVTSMEQPTTSKVMPQQQQPIDDSHDKIVQNEETKDVKNRNLSDMVEHTKFLIQQMKNEINEDIAASASEFGDGDLSDGIIYSDDEMGEFSDSWEDISGEESIISGDGSEFSERFEYDDRENDFDSFVFRQSSQSVDSEFFVEAQESLTSENEQMLEESEETVTVVQAKEISANNQEEKNEQNENNPAELDGERSVTENQSVDKIQSTSEVVNTAQQSVATEITVSSSVPPENAQTPVVIQTTENVNDSIQNDNQITIQSPEIASEDHSTEITVPPIDETLMEHMLEIQQSLQTSSIVSINFRETTLREKSQSVDPNSSNPQTPDPPRSETNETINIEAPTVEPNTANENSEQTHETDPLPSQPDELITQQRTELPNSSVSSDNESKDSIKQGIEMESQNPELEEKDDEEPASTSEQQQSVSNSEKISSQANDTESEMDDISMDASVSTSTSSSSKDNLSIHSTMSTVSNAASEKLVESFKYQKISVPVITQCSSTKINVMQLKKSATDKIIPKNKIPVRRPSITEPSASIRNIQNELFNKQLRQPPKIVPKKPSKIVPPKLFFKSNANTESNTSLPATAKTTKIDQNKPSTSNGETTTTKKPKKKYYETCFSDDNYQTSDDENPIARPSTKVIPNLVQIVEYAEDSFDLEVNKDQNSRSASKITHFFKSILYP